MSLENFLFIMSGFGIGFIANSFVFYQFGWRSCHYKTMDNLIDKMNKLDHIFDKEIFFNTRKSKERDEYKNISNQIDTILRRIRGDYGFME